MGRDASNGDESTKWYARFGPAIERFSAVGSTGTWPNGSAWLVLVLAILLAALGTNPWWADDLVDADWFVRLAGTVVCVLSGLVFVLFIWAGRTAQPYRFRRAQEPEPTETPEDDGDLPELRSKHDLLAELIEEPWRRRMRVVENVTLRGDVLHHHVSTLYDLGRYKVLKNDFPLIVPVTRRRKGELVDNFSVRDAAGCALSTLPHVRQIATLEEMLVHVIADQIDTSSEEDIADLRRLRREIRRILGSAPPDSKLDEVERPAEERAARSSDIGEVADIALRMVNRRRRKRNEWPAVTVENTPELTRFRKLLSKLERTHPILAIVPPEAVVRDRKSTTLLVKYEMTGSRSTQEYLQNRPPRARRVFLWVKELVRTATLTSSTVIPIPARKALASDSYHLRFTAPNGYIVVDHALIEDPKESDIGRRRRGPTIPLHKKGSARVPYVRLPDVDYQNYTHLYTRKLGRHTFLWKDDEGLVRKEKVEKPVLVVQIAEELPGVLGRAFAAAVGTFFVLWVVFALTGQAGRGDPAASDGNNVDLVAFILAVPGFIAAWAGLGPRSGARFAALSARLSIVISVVLSLVASAVYIRRTTPLDDDSIDGFGTFLGIHPLADQVLLGVALTNLVWIFCVLAIRVLRRQYYASDPQLVHRRASARSDELDLEYEKLEEKYVEQTHGGT